jgi:UDP-glucuronate 4-epimerase
LGNSKPVSLSDLILLFEQVGGKKLNLVKQEIPAGDVELTFADITKAKQFLDWAPQTGIQTGIENLLKWYSNSIK